MKNYKSIVKALGIGLAIVALPAAASAAGLTFTNTIGGDTTGGGPYTLTSTDSTFSVLRFINNELVDFGQLTSLSLDFDSVLGGVGGGAPRIAVVTDADKNGSADGFFIILLGPAGSFANPALGPQSSGNLISMNDVGRYDLSGIGGSAYTNYDAALASAANFGVLRFSLILDSFGGADKTIVVAANGLSASAEAAVPEPATWAMMVAGFGLLGAALRRRSTPNLVRA